MSILFAAVGAGVIVVCSFVIAEVTTDRNRWRREARRARRAADMYSRELDDIHQTYRGYTMHEDERKQMKIVEEARRIIGGDSRP